MKSSILREVNRMSGIIACTMVLIALVIGLTFSQLDFDSWLLNLQDNTKYTRVRNGWHRIDLGPFSIETPQKFRHIPQRGIDSYVGLIADKKDTLFFDYGWYSYSYEGDRYIRSHDTIQGKKAIVALVDDQLQGVHFPSANGQNQLTISGDLLNDETVRKVLRSIKIGGRSGYTSSRLGENKEIIVALEGRRLFKQNCSHCHLLDRKMIGPPLRHIVERTSKEWLVNWVKNSAELILTNEKAAALYEEYGQIPHVPFKSFTDQQITHLIEFLEQPSPDRDIINEWK
ncbi:MAG: cytochrome c [Bacteroidota bacterium]